MKKSFLHLLTACTVILLPLIAQAQFEGKITFRTYDIEDSGSPQDDDEFTMFVTPERILLQGNNRYEVVGSIRSRGVLIRLDVEDFVFFTEKENALTISKSNIDALLNLAGMNNKKGASGTGLGYSRAGETKTIKGYRCELFVFEDKENKQNRVEVWMTGDLDINWGMLGNTWGDGLSELLGGDAFPVALIFKESYFPLEVKVYESGRLTGGMQAQEVSSSTVARAMVQIPSGVKVLSFEEYLFQNYGNR